MRTSASDGKDEWEEKWKSRRAVRVAPPRPKAPPCDIKKTWKWWEHVRQDDWWLSQQPISYNAMCAALGIGAEVLRLAVEGYKPPGTIPARLAGVIDRTENRELCFPLRKSGGKKKGESSGPYFLIVERPLSPSKIQKISVEIIWSLHARCVTCSGNKFLPISIDAKPYVACYQCLPPSQFPAIGATRVEKSLIHEALKKFY